MEQGLDALSRAVEEAIEDEVSELSVAKALEKLIESTDDVALTVFPVKPRIRTDAGRVVREVRELRG